MVLVRFVAVCLIAFDVASAAADPVAVGTGDANGELVGIGAFGNSTGFVAVSGTGNA